jgi:GNAT superfamily N-acetyltransferase
MNLPQLEETFREFLKDMAVYKPDDKVHAVEHNGHICIGYNQSHKNYPASISLQLEGKVCYILTMEVHPELRREGVGTALYKAVELFCLQQGITTMETTPSGQGVSFWPMMGFTAIKRIGGT